MRLARTWSVVMCMVFLTASITLAANVHLKPPHRSPSFVDHGLTLSALGALAGLGNEDILIVLTATAQPTAVCINPGSGGHQPPGQNPAEVEVSGAQAIPASAIKNGNVDFNVTTQAPVSPVPGAPDCPNPNWTEAITDMTFTSATIEVQQPPGTIVFSVTCTLSGPASGTAGSLTASGCP